MQRNRTFDGCDRKVPSLPLHRLPHALRDHGWIVVDRERHGALESVRPRNEHAETAVEWVTVHPRFIRTCGAPAAGDHRRLDALTAVTGDTVDREHRERHTA